MMTWQQQLLLRLQMADLSIVEIDITVHWQADRTANGKIC